MAHFGSSRPPRELGKRSHRDDEDGQAADTAEKQQETPKSNKSTGKHYVYGVPCTFKRGVLPATEGWKADIIYSIKEVASGRQMPPEIVPACVVLQRNMTTSTREISSNSGFLTKLVSRVIHGPCYLLRHCLSCVSVNLSLCAHLYAILCKESW